MEPNWTIQEFTFQTLAHQDKPNHSCKVTQPIPSQNFRTKLQNGDETRILANIEQNKTCPKTSPPKKWSDDVEDMDWEPVPDSSNFKEINSIENPTAIFPKNDTHEFLYNHLDFRRNELVICVDTNVLLSLSVVRTILDGTLNAEKNPVVFVPWIVLQELDYIKDNNSRMKSNAQKAIKFINEKLQNGDLIVETLESFDRSYDLRPDDKIIRSSLKLAKRHKVILLSNDINLRNKSLVHQIEAFDQTNILERLSNINNDCDMDSNVHHAQIDPHTLTKNQQTPYNRTNFRI